MPITVEGEASIDGVLTLTLQQESIDGTTIPILQAVSISGTFIVVVVEKTAGVIVGTAIGAVFSVVLLLIVFSIAFALRARWARKLVSRASNKKPYQDRGLYI